MKYDESAKQRNMQPFRKLSFTFLWERALNRTNENYIEF